MIDVLDDLSAPGDLEVEDGFDEHVCPLHEDMDFDRELSDFDRRMLEGSWVHQGDGTYQHFSGLCDTIRKLEELVRGGRTDLQSRLDHEREEAFRIYTGEERPKDDGPVIDLWAR